MTQIPITKETIDRIAQSNKIANPGKASIREMRKMIQDVEAETGIRFVKMEMGIPGLPAAQVGVEAEIEALRNGVASIYPEIYGTQDVKDQISLFVKNFLVFVNKFCLLHNEMLCTFYKMPIELGC